MVVYVKLYIHVHKTFGRFATLQAFSVGINSMKCDNNSFNYFEYLSVFFFFRSGKLNTTECQFVEV